MISALIIALNLLGPPALPQYPVIIVPDKDAYTGKDHIRITLKNPGKTTVSVAPFLPFERSEGDGTWTPVYKLRAVAVCADEPPKKAPCIRLGPGESITLAPWDWNTGGYDQCPPRRPGIRAFKGVYRITASWCSGSAPERGTSRVKLVTWE